MAEKWEETAAESRWMRAEYLLVRLFSTKTTFREDHGSPRMRWMRAIAAPVSAGRR